MEKLEKDKDNNSDGTKKTAEKNTTKMLFLLLTLLVTSTTYTVLNRSSSDFIKYSVYISGITGIIFLSAILYFFFKGGMKKPENDDLFMLLPVLIATIAIGPLYYSLGASINDLYSWIQKPTITKEKAVPIILGITVVGGFSLFYFRLKARSFYGLTEAMVGIGVAMQKASVENVDELSKSSFYVAILTASIYLFVRGLDNIHQGITKEPYDYYASKIYNKLKAK